MKRIEVAVSLLIVGCLGPWSSAAEPPKPPELKVLEKFVGTWDSESVSKPAAWTPKEVREKSMEVNEMALDGWYLQGSSRTPEGKVLAIVMNSYDPPEKTYRIWRFLPVGRNDQWTGQWDEATSTLTIKTDIGHGMTATGAIHFTDQDHHELHFLVKDSEGKVYVDSLSTVVRRK
jgi:hypothetical protein